MKCKRRSALSLATERGHAECLSVVLSVAGPSLHSQQEDPAWLAVENFSRGDPVRCVELLSQDWRVDWNTRNMAGDTPIMFCLKNNKTEMARILLNNPRVDLHTKNKDGKYIENIVR